MNKINENIYIGETNKQLKDLTNIGTTTLFKQRTYTTGWNNEGIINSNTKYLYILLKGSDDYVGIMVPMPVAKTFTTAAPYFIKNKNNLIYQFGFNGDYFWGLFRSEAGQGYTVYIYEIK